MNAFSPRVRLCVYLFAATLLGRFAVAQSCPTTAPLSTNSSITYSGTGCNYGSNQPCLLSQPVTFSVPSGYTVQACDSLQWNFSDGTGVTTTTGAQSVAHTFSGQGGYSISVYVSNSLGSRYYFGSVLVSSTPGCPTSYPPTTVLQYSSSTCTSQNTSLPCAPNQPVTFTVVPYFSGVLESCDVATINFGDGTSATLPAGVFSTTHTYSSTGSFNPYTSVQNAVGTSGGFSTSLISANGLVRVSSSGNTLTEGSVAHFTVTRTGGSGAFTVNYATSNGSALAGTHYTPTSGVLSFASGEDSKSIDVSTIDDGLYNGQLYFNLGLSSPSNGFLLTGSTSVQQYITDNDIPTITFPNETINTTENSGVISVAVNRSGDASKVVSMTYRVYSNYCCDSSNPPVTNTSGTLIFGAGETTKSVSVALVNNDVYTGFRTATVELSALSGGTFPSTYYYYYYATVNIADDEPMPTVTVQPASVKEGNSGTTVVPVTISLSGKTSSSVNVSCFLFNGSARSGSDYQPNSNFVTIAAGSTSTTCSVTVLGDTLVEPDETFTLSAQGISFPPCCASGSSVNVAPVSGTITILNDDASISPATQNVAKGSTGTILVDVGQGVSQPLTLNVTSSAPSIASVPATITIPVGFARGEIPVTGNELGDATISTTLPPQFGGTPVSARVTIYEGASLVFDPKSVALNVGQSATLKVSAQPALGAPLFVALSASDASIIEVPASVTIPPGQSATITIKALKTGVASLRAQLPPQNGAAALFVPVEVTEVPATPAISRVQPANGPIAGGTNVTVDGSKLTSDCILVFGGALATNVTFVNANSLTATTPPHAAGAVDAVLNCSGGSYTLPNGFTYIATGASISSVTPSFGSVDGGTYVRISGANFVPGCWPFFDGNAARGAVMKSAAEIIATSPAHSAGGVDVSLHCGAATVATLANAYTYNAGAEPSPVITSLDPLAGSAGQSVTVSGARFVAGDKVTFDSTTATILGYAPDALTVRVPDLSLGKVAVTVTDPNGHSSTTGPIFTVTEPFPPQIASATPSTVRAGGELTLDGNGFRPGYSFAIGDTKATTVTMSYKKAVIRVPDMAAGNYAVNVLNANGQLAAIGPAVTVSTNGVVVKAVAPGCVTTDGGVTITISGSGFASGATVTVEGVAATNVRFVDAQTLTATLPAGSPGNPLIVVTNPNGDRGTLTGGLLEYSPLDPNGGCVSKRRPVHH